MTHSYAWYIPAWRTPNKLSKDSIKRHLAEGIEHLKSLDTLGCYYFDLERIHNYYYAIVLGWTPSDDDSAPNDGYYKDGYHLTTRLARCPVNSGMWCDLDFDWLLPPLNEEGDLWDTDEYLYPDSDTDKIVEGLFKEWEEMKKFYTENNI